MMQSADILASGGEDYEKNIFMDCLGHVPLSGV